MQPCTSCGGGSSSIFLTKNECGEVCPPKEETEKYCCGEGYMILPDGCGNLIRTKWVSEANPELLSETIDNLKTGIEEFYEGPVEDPFDLEKVLSLGIFCDQSVVQIIDSTSPCRESLANISGVGTSTNPLDRSAVDVFSKILINLKNYLQYLEITVKSRLISNDLLFLVLTLNVYDTPVGTPGRFLVVQWNIYGQYYISACGREICIDWITANKIPSLLA